MISQELSIFIVSASIIGLTIALLALILASYAAIKVVGMEKSTHTVQYVDPSIEQANKEFMETMDEWATTEESLDAQNEMTKAEIADDLEFFSEKGSEKFSF